MAKLQAAQFSQEQKNILIEMQKDNCYEEYISPFLLLMATCGYARNPHDLVGIVREYPGMGNEDKLSQVVKDCIEDNYLVVTIDQGNEVCYMSDEGYDKFVGNYSEQIKKMIAHCKDSFLHSECVFNYGLLSGRSTKGKTNTTFLQRIKEAQDEILLPMLNTDAHDSTVAAIRERAENGVKIKILLADYDKVVVKLRSKKASTIQNWVEKCKDYKNIEIRIYDEIEESILASSVIIDRSITRMCVVDTLKEKTSNGTLIECYKEGYDLNITKLLCDKFDDIWEKSRPVNRSKFADFMRGHLLWLNVSLAIVFFLSLIIPEGAWNLIFSNLFAALLGIDLVEIAKEIKPKIKKFAHLFNKIKEN